MRLPESKDEREVKLPSEVGGDDGPPEAEEPISITASMLSERARPDVRLEFERGMSYLPRMALAVVVINVVAFVWQVQTGALESREAVVAAGALYREAVWRGEWWRLFSAMFLHGSVDHLIGNCIALYIVGMPCEHAVGFTRAAVVYLVSGLSGSALSVTMSPGPSLGASGAIFGVLESVVVFLYKYQKFFFLRDKRIGFVLMLWAGYQVAIGFLTPFVDNFAHLGGLAGGALVTLMVGSPVVAAWRARQHGNSDMPPGKEGGW